jgi:hypothetical protein
VITFGLQQLIDMNDSFIKGFVEQCVDSELSVQDTNRLVKTATLAALFENPNFKEGFSSIADMSDLSELEKAALVKDTLERLLQAPVDL